MVRIGGVLQKVVFIVFFFLLNEGWIFCFSSGIDGRVTEICGYADLFFLKSLEKYQDIFEIFVRMSFSFVQKEK